VSPLRHKVDSYSPAHNHHATDSERDENPGPNKVNGYRPSQAFLPIGDDWWVDDAAGTK